MYYTPGWGAGRVEFQRIANRRRGFVDEVATAIQRVNAIAELTRYAVISLSLRPGDVATVPKRCLPPPTAER
jgi:hypothetical protein